MQFKAVVVCLGDSLTYGYPYGPRHSWVYYAAHHCPLNLINAGVNGETVEEMNNRFQREVLDRQPTAVVILGGTNDAFSTEVTIAQTLYNMGEMIKKALDAGITPIIGLPTPVVEPDVATKLDRIISSYRELAARLELPVIDFYTPFIDQSGGIRVDLLMDGVHPDDTGYQLMGRTALAFFNSYFLHK